MLRTTLCLLAAALAASPAVAGEAKIIEGKQRGPGAPPAAKPKTETRLFFRQPANFNIDSLVHKPDPAAIPKRRPHLVIWQMGPGAVATPVTWDAGRYTGFTPPAPLKSRQRGPEDHPGATVVQAYSDTVGVHLAPGRATRTNDIQPVVYAYSWPDSDAPRPWAVPGSSLFFSFEIQVPSVEYSGPGVPYITAPMILRDSKSGSQFWVNPSVFDPRGGFKEKVWSDRCPGCTGLSMVSSFFGTGTRFVRLGAGSARSESKPFSGFRRFSYEIGEPELKAMISRLRSERGLTLSADPADYELMHANVNPEFHFPKGTEGHLSTSFRRIEIGAIIPLEPVASSSPVSGAGSGGSGGGSGSGGGPGSGSGGGSGGAVFGPVGPGGAVFGPVGPGGAVFGPVGPGGESGSGSGSGSGGAVFGPVGPGGAVFGPVGPGGGSGSGSGKGSGGVVFGPAPPAGSPGGAGKKGPSEAAMIAALESAGKTVPSGGFVEGPPPTNEVCTWSVGDTCIEGESIRYWEPASGLCPKEIRYEVKAGRSGGFFCDKEKTRTTEWACFEDPLCAGTMEGWVPQKKGCYHRVVDWEKCRAGASAD